MCFASHLPMGRDAIDNVFQLRVAQAMPSEVVFLVQSRNGTHEFVLSAERLTLDGLTFVTAEPLGHLHERLLVDICLEGRMNVDTVGLVASVEAHMEGVGTRVRFIWTESNPKSEQRLRAFVAEHCVVRPGLDFPLTAFAVAA